LFYFSPNSAYDAAHFREGRLFRCGENFNYPRDDGNAILKSYLGQIFLGQIFSHGASAPYGDLSAA
jgi:hypothetical protein